MKRPEFVSSFDRFVVFQQVIVEPPGKRIGAKRVERSAEKTGRYGLERAFRLGNKNMADRGATGNLFARTELGKEPAVGTAGDARRPCG